MRPPTRQWYQTLLGELDVWALKQGHPKMTVHNADDMLAAWMEADFLEGQQSNRGGSMQAAVRYRWPAFGRGGSLRLPRAMLAAKGRAPPCSRLPLPLEVVSLIAEIQFRNGHPWYAFLTTLAFYAYLRPSEAFKLRAVDLIKPLGFRPHHRWSLVLHATESRTT